MLDLVLVFVVTLLAVRWFILKRQETEKMPPSPAIALPFIGHLYLLKSDPMEQIEAWRKQLGNLFTLEFGSQKVVMVNNYEDLHELLIKHHDAFTDRQDNFASKEILNNKGVFSLKGEEWREQRAFLHAALRDLGLGKNIMAMRIQEEVDLFLKEIARSGGEPTDLSHLIFTTVCNNICRISFGYRFSYTDERLKEMLATLQRTFELLGASAVINVFPILKHLPGDYFHDKELIRINRRMRDLVWECINKKGRTINVHDSEFEDLAQAYLTEIERKKAAGITNTSIDEENLVGTIWNLFNAGTETTSKTIQFALLYLVYFPDVQEKLYQEIVDHIGTGRSPEMKDKPKLKYLNAFISETIRFCKLGPFGPDRQASKDVMLRGYLIPTGTVILPVYDTLMWNEDVWEDPSSFRPERFVDCVRKEFTPFSIGKRNCLGESMAIMELFLCLAGMIQRFRFLPEYSGKKPSLAATYGFTRTPTPFKVRAVPRG